ncbi:MAG: hypothetical protein IJW77_11360 [Clostridia bacterium]|nr:hypothetical protein [Clostridia bacterium]
MRKSYTVNLLCILCAVILVLSSCTGGRGDGVYYAANRTFAGFDLAEALGVSFENTLIDLTEPAPGEAPLTPVTPDGQPNESDAPTSFIMRVYDKMEIFAKVGDTSPISTLSAGTLIELAAIENSIWAEVSSMEGKLLGYAKDGFLRAIDPESAVYAELPIEYGMAKTNDETYVPAYSHLVDIRKYLRVLESTNPADWQYADLSDYDVIVSMQLSTPETTIKEPFYDRNLCLVQYDLLPKMLEAIELLRRDGYTMVIYDAYRPTSVQQRWFDVVRQHKWVADPSRGMGGVHDRGTALDISIIDRNGKLIEMPTPMHTFTEAASRLSTTMTDTARKNMNYLRDVMVSCGFDIINSEWWHFQDVNTVYYLPTDHPIDEIPLMVSEMAVY